MKWTLNLLVASVFLAGMSCRKPDAEPQPGVRVISLAPNLTEIVCAIGGRDLLVGRTSACDYPPEVANVKVIGGFGAPSMELLTAAAPTLILDVALEDETIGQRIERLGLRRERIRCQKLDEIPDAIEKVGSLIGREAPAREKAAELRKRIAELRAQAKAASNPPSVYVEIWHDPVMTAGKKSFLSELVTLAGGRNIGNDVDKDYFQVSPEWILVKNPDVILCLYMSDRNSARQLVIHRNGWDTLNAVQTGRVFDGFDNNLVLRPGPRVLESIELLRNAISIKATP